MTTPPKRKINPEWLLHFGLPEHGGCPVCGRTITGATRQAGRLREHGPIVPSTTTLRPCGHVLSPEADLLEGA